MDRFQHRECSLSLSLGELIDLVGKKDFSFARGYQFAKVGLSFTVHANWQEHLAQVQESLPVGTELAITYYVDRHRSRSPDFESILHFAYIHDLPAILFDTFDKGHGSLFDDCLAGELAEFNARCRYAGLKMAIAGSIEREHLALIELIDPEYIAVRTAVCSPSRRGSLDRDKVRDLLQDLGTIHNTKAEKVIQGKALSY